MLERGFLIFWVFLLFVLEFSSPGRVWTEFRTEIVIFYFSVYLISYWLKIVLDTGFLIFWIFFYFFRNFLPLVEHEQNIGLNFFFLFLGLSYPVLAKNNAWKWFLKFFNFFAIFFRIFLLGSSMNGIRD